MQAKLVRIGNSRGVRLPKEVIEAAGLTEELDLEVKHGAVIIRGAARTRRGWAQAAATCREDQQDVLPDWDAAVADGDWS